MGRRTRPKPLRRTSGTRPERRVIVVFCEGENTEPDYVKGLRQLPEVRANTSLQLELDPNQGVPLTLVQHAVERQVEGEVDECWCLFDVEWPRHHPNLREAIDLAERNEIKLAISNPTFELWLLLHFKDQRAFLDNDGAERASKELDQRPGKSIDAALYLPLRQTAASRAANLERKHMADGTSFPDDNPSSGMHHFLAAIEPPQPAETET